MDKPKAVILRTAGTNCDWETRCAFKLAGASAKSAHINRLIRGQVRLDDYDILAIPGGFSYGDDIASGKILANELKYKLGQKIKEFALQGNPIIGICNGFQVLVKMGLLPDTEAFEQTTSLTFNDSDKFECRWVNLKKMQNANCKLQITKARKKKLDTKKENFWLKDLPEIIQLPVAHAEGKFVVSDKKLLSELERNKQVAFRYVNDKGKPGKYPFNPNGAVNSIAGIFNKQGNILGLMPHPERFIYRWQHPNRCAAGKDSEFGWGLQLFKNAVEYAVLRSRE